jgi:hypothetical protein
MCMHCAFVLKEGWLCQGKQASESLISERHKMCVCVCVRINFGRVNGGWVGQGKQASYVLLSTNLK